MNSDTWFLLVHNRYKGSTHVEEFADPRRAAVAYGETERRYSSCSLGADPEVAVLLVGAPSINDVKRLYPTYFGGPVGPRAQRGKKLLAKLKAVPAA